MNLKYLKKVSIIWLVVEIICVITFLLIIVNKLSFSDIVFLIFGTMLITLLIVVILSIQIKQTWLHMGDTIGKIVNWFWLFGSGIGILTILINIFIIKKEIVIFIPIFVAMFLTGIYWKKYMYRNNVNEIKKKREKDNDIKNREKIRI